MKIARNSMNLGGPLSSEFANFRKTFCLYQPTIFEVRWDPHYIGMGSFTSYINLDLTK